MSDKSLFTLLEGGRDTKPTVINTLLVETMADSHSPLPVDIRIFEEDTFLVLTVDPVMRYTEEHPVRLMTNVAETKPNKPGTIVTNKKSWYAVVHDLDHDPVCRPEWVKSAYQQALMLCEIKRIQCLGMPLLGTVHGNFPLEISLEILVHAIRATTFEHLKTLCLLTPRKDCEQVRQYLLELSP